MSRSLLQRTSQVGREIAIIVIGVSVALGADALYDRRQQNRERVRILQALVSDLQSDSVSYAAALADTRESDATKALLNYLDNPTAVLSRLDLARAVRESIIFSSGQKESATYRELTMTGRLSLIDDPALRKALLQYYSRPFIGIPPEIWSGYLANVYYPYDASLRRHLGADYVGLMRCPVRPGDSQYEECILSFTRELNVDRLRADADFMEQLVGMTTGTSRWDLYMRNEARAHQELAEQIGTVQR